MGYTIWPDGLAGEVLSDIYKERIRQEDLKELGKFTFTCADLECTQPERLSVLTEEVGEVAREVTEGIIRARMRLKPTSDFGTDECDVDKEKLRKELVQVAAVCVAWCEALDKTQT
jgi:NTP pyrophosphatase (non-canonical NTP hydrolase)